MNCQHTRILLSSYADQELPLDLYYAVKKHLDSCRNCRIEFQNMILVKKLISRSTIGHCQNTGLSDRVRSRLSSCCLD